MAFAAANDIMYVDMHEPVDGDQMVEFYFRPVWHLIKEMVGESRDRKVHDVAFYASRKRFASAKVATPGGRGVF